MSGTHVNMASVRLDRVELRFSIPGQPVPASRPRVTKNGVFHFHRYRDWLDSAKVYARQSWLGKEPLDSFVSVTVTFWEDRIRADIDNLIKGILDCMTGVILVDDRQVLQLHALRFPGHPEPRTDVTVVEISRPKVVLKGEIS
jgi:Holliday junction resolvase RusA-like endonuclease